jgi:hypothetical protein
LLLTAALAVGGCRPSNPTVAASPNEPARQPAAVTFDTPSGFSATEDYAILVPLLPARVTQFLAPTGMRSLDVIVVNSYVLDADLSEAGDDQLLLRIGGYARLVRATAMTSAERTRVAGYRAWQQAIEQPGEGGPYRYDTTYVFAGWYLVQVMCQHDDQPDLIATGCRTVLDTLRIVVI